jgi:hypothetical protein
MDGFYTMGGIICSSARMKTELLGFHNKLPEDFG